MQKKGQSVGIDFSVGLFVMLLIIGISINYISNSVSTKSSFSEPIKNAAYSTINKLTRNLQWIVYQMPILVETNHSLTNQKLGFYFNFSKVDVNSVILLQNGEMIPYLRIDNSVLFEANLSSGKNLIQLTYTKDTNLDYISPISSFNSSQPESFFTYPLKILSETEIVGLSEEKIQEYFLKTNDQIGEILNLGSFEFNITIPGEISVGGVLPESQETYVLSTPRHILYRFGNQSTKRMEVAIWA